LNHYHRLSDYNHIQQRTFTTTALLCKRKKDSEPSSTPHPQSQSPPDSPPSSLDLLTEHTKLEKEISHITTRLKDELSKLRVSGKADPGILENLDVVVDKNAHTKMKLKDLAHVVTKGRALVINVYEEGVCGSSSFDI
jgi:hypothetical protein